MSDLTLWAEDPQQVNEWLIINAMLLGGERVIRAIQDEGLRPEHFEQYGMRLLYAGILDLLDRGEDVDAVTLTAALEESAIDPPMAPWRELTRQITEDLPPCGAHFRQRACVVRDLAEIDPSLSVIEHLRHYCEIAPWIRKNA